MTYQYKAPTRVILQPQVQLIKKQSPSIIQTLPIVKQQNPIQLRIYESVLKMIDLLIKKKRNKLLKQSFSKLKIIIAQRVKYSNFIAKKIQILFKVKHKIFIHNAFQNLISNGISCYKQLLVKHQKQKAHIKQKITAIIFYALQKKLKKRISQAFFDLKVIGNLYFKTKNFKIKHLTSRISVIIKSKIQQAFTRLIIKNSQIALKFKLLHQIESLFKIKSKISLAFGFHKLKINLIKKKQNNIKSQSKISQKKQNTIQVIKKDDRTQLQSQNIQLQRQHQSLLIKLKTLQSQQKNELTSQRQTLACLQKQKQSLLFSNQLLSQSNLQLQEQIKCLQNQLIPRKKLPKHQLWQSVYHNLIFYLQTNKHRSVTKQELLKAMEMPLVPIPGNVQQVREENQVLQDLLHQYQKCFTQPQHINDSIVQIALPFHVVKQQNKYYLMVLEVLAEWGMQGSSQLQQLKQDLQTLQTKINPN